MNAEFLKMLFYSYKFSFFFLIKVLFHSVDVLGNPFKEYHSVQVNEADIPGVLMETWVPMCRLFFHQKELV